MCVFGGAGFGRGDPQESWVNKIIMMTFMDTMGKVKKIKKKDLWEWVWIHYIHIL